jgi:adenosylcobinamide-GDP ribazoletransferase
LIERPVSLLRQQLRAAAAAFTFLTRLPVGRIVSHDLSDLSRSAAYFPLVGLIVGAIGAGVFVVAQLIWAPLIAVVLSVAATVLVTGAFHEDALADSLDGFGGGWTKEQVLTIMKDSRVGSYALIGVAIVVVAKVSSLLSIHELASAVKLSQFSPGADWAVARALMAAHVLARWSSVLLIRTHEYVRIEEVGTKPAAGRPFVNAISNAQFALATAISLAVVIPMLGIQTFAAGLTTIVVAVAAGRYFKRRIGGITGDALGAANQIVELTIYLVLAARPVEWMFA